MLTIIRKDGKPIGWELNPITDEEQTIAGIIRDLQFFGIKDFGTNIVYDGLTLLDETKGKQHGNIKSLRWIQSNKEE